VSILLSSLRIFVGPVCVVLIVLLLARGSEPKRYWRQVRVAVAIALVLALSHVADIMFPTSSTLVSFAISLALALAIGLGLSLIESLISSKSPSA